MRAKWSDPLRYSPRRDRGLRPTKSSRQKCCVTTESLWRLLAVEHRRHKDARGGGTE